MKQINSNIFGKVNMLEESDVKMAELKQLIENYPVNAFGILNKLLNSKGMMFSITQIDKNQYERN